MKHPFTKAVVIAMAAAMLSACMDNDDVVTEADVTVTPSLGRVTHATVHILDQDGETILGSGDTGADGSATIRIKNHNRSIVVAVMGDDDAMYYDEAFGTLMPFPVGAAIHALAPSAQSQVTATALTEFAYQNALFNGEFPISPSKAQEYNEQVRANFGAGIDDILTPPVIFDASIGAAGLSDNHAGRYALILAALAEAGKDNTSPALGIMQEIIQDISADGDIDDSTLQTRLNMAMQTMASNYGSIGLQNNLPTITITLGDDSASGGNSTATGEWTLVISGTATAAGIATPIPEITINKTTPPDATDTQAIEDQIVTQAGSAGASVNSVQFTLVSSSDSLVVVEAHLSMTQSGLTITEDLTYTWTLNAGAAGGDTGSASAGDDATTGSGADLVPDSLKGTIADLTYGYAQTGSPYQNGDKLKFTFSSSGALMLGDNYATVAEAPVQQAGSSELIWNDTTHGYAYAVSLTNTGALNEINVSAIGGTPWYGQFY